jgi:hypothetical protein
MLIYWLSQALFGTTTLLLCALTSRAVLRRDLRAAWLLTLSGAFALTFFLSLNSVRLEMLGVAALAVVAGILMAPSQEDAPKRPTIAFDTTATRRRR